MSTDGLWGVVLGLWVLSAVPPMIRAISAEYGSRKKPIESSVAEKRDRYTVFTWRWTAGFAFLLTAHELGFHPVIAALVLTTFVCTTYFLKTRDIKLIALSKSWWTSRQVRTRRIVTGWILWIGFVISYIILFDPFDGYLSAGDVLRVVLWAAVPPALLLGTIHWWRSYRG